MPNKPPPTSEIPGVLSLFMFTVTEVEAMTGLSRSFLYEEMRDGRLISVSAGRCRRIRGTDLAAYIARLPTTDPTTADTPSPTTIRRAVTELRRAA